MMTKKTMYEEVVLPLKCKLRKDATHLGEPQKNDVQFMDSLLEKLNKWVENLPEIFFHLLLQVPLQTQVSNRTAANYQNSSLAPRRRGIKRKKNYWSLNLNAISFALLFTWSQEWISIIRNLPIITCLLMIIINHRYQFCDTFEDEQRRHSSDLLFLWSIHFKLANVVVVERPETALWQC